MFISTSRAKIHAVIWGKSLYNSTYNNQTQNDQNKTQGQWTKHLKIACELIAGNLSKTNSINHFVGKRLAKNCPYLLI